MMDRLRQTLAAAGYDLAATELLDVLWLARAMEGEGRKEPATGPQRGEPGDRERAAGEPGEAGKSEDPGAPGAVDEVAGAAGRGEGADEAAGDARTAAGTTPERPAEPADADRPAGHADPLAPSDPPRRALYAMGSQGGGPDGGRARPARVPGGRALPDARQLGGALRPLRRTHDHPHRTVPDVEATVRLTAETGFLDVVSRPDRERHWSAELWVDTSPAMQVWGSLAAELRTLLVRSGVFRSVRVRAIDPRGPGGPLHGRRSGGATVTFVLTDGTDPGWRGPQAVRSLTACGRGGPVAVINPLPRRLWRGTALDARPQLLSAPGEFDPPGRLVVCDPLSGERDPEAAGLFALPVLHPTASALQQWVGLLTRPGVPHLIDTALLAGTPQPAPPSPPHGSAEELLSHFRGAFSPEAYRLAVRLSAIRPLTTPLMQLVRAATMRDAGPTHVAEILLGGLLERTDRTADATAVRTLDRALGPPPPGGPLQPVYDFRPGVRELLFSGLGTEQAVEVVEAVGRSLEPYMGRLPDFPVLMGDDEGELRLHASARAFAVLASPVLERMGGAVPGQRTGGGPEPLRGVPPPRPAKLRFTVLGPLRARRGQAPLTLGSPQQRALLAALLLRRGRWATASELVAGLWGDEPPPRARAALRTYASRLRRALGEDGELLVSERGGYALRGPDGSPPALDLDEAEQLIARARATRDPEEARRLRDAALELWHGEPLAGLPGPYAAAQRVRLARWWSELLAEANPWQAPAAGQLPGAGTPPGRSALRKLDDRLTRDARRALRLLSVPEGPDLSAGAAAALLDVPADRGRALLEELRTAGALTETAPGRYGRAGEALPPARELRSELPAEERTGALSRLLTWYLALGRQVHTLRYPGERLPQDLVRVPAAVLPPLQDAARALAVWTEETPPALALVRQAVADAPKLVRRAADLLLLAQVTADCGAHAAAFEPAAAAVAARAAMDGDARAEARARVALAECTAAVGRFARAEREARQAVRLARTANDPLALFRAPLAAGVIALHQRRHDDAERHLTAAWERCRGRDDRLGEAAVLGALARVWAATGSSDAVLFAERGVGFHRTFGDDSPGLAHARYALAQALSAAGRHADALRELFQALPLFEEDRQRLWAGRTRSRMAAEMVALIRPGEAVSAAEDAAGRLLVPGGERWRADALTALGQAETALGRKQSAQGHWREALAVYEEFDAPEAAEVRALLRERAATAARPRTGGARPAAVSRTADAASTGTALRELTAAVRTLRDQLRLQHADAGRAEPGHGATAGSSGNRGIEALEALEALEAIESIEAELTGLLADFERTSRVRRAELGRLRADLESAMSAAAPGERGAGAAEAAGAVRELSRRLAP
ncbi:SAV_2336 N-terminal domain-related protein [Streptomyces sp. N2A]|uniref:SAV_2336 N-terminal domain-related protein n=1 Tax=Streptomyces sp. N2A TaxID=3073936 RepID=UPI00286FB5C3|nr:SAV_2336 N-terminal domain-related protein [Streptomyces sp. N2A]